MFELSPKEYNSLKISLRSQIVTLDTDGRGKYPKYPPFAFTKMGVAMRSSVLRSETAIMANIAIMRAFVTMRNYIMTTQQVTAELAEIRAKLEILERNDEDNIAATNDLSEDMRKEIDNIYQAIQELLSGNPLIRAFSRITETYREQYGDCQSISGENIPCRTPVRLGGIIDEMIHHSLC